VRKKKQYFTEFTEAHKAGIGPAQIQDIS